MNVATAHLVTPDAAGQQAVLSRARTVLRERHSIEQCTLQIETGDPPDGDETGLVSLERPSSFH